MSECGITIQLSVNETTRAAELILTFQELYKIEQQNVDEIKALLTNSFGARFTKIIYSEISTEGDVLEYKKYLKKDLTNNIDLFMFSLRNKTTNEKRLWQDSYSGNVSPKEISPANIKLVTRSRTGKSYWDTIELYYDSDENYALKAAVFAAAFESAGFEVESLSSYTEYEDDYEDTEI